MDKPVTAENVWQAYRALHRYVLNTQKAPKARTKKSMKSGELPEQAPAYPKTLRQDIEGLSARLTAHYNGNEILICSPLYYAYVYLFVQLLRCSLKSKPSFAGEGIGWERLVWHPLRALRGRSDVAERTFVGWYKRLGSPQHKTEDELRKLFPFYENRVRISLEAVQQQLQRLLRELSFGGTVRGIMRDATPQGTRRLAGQPNQWHPMFLLSRMECWIPDSGGRIVEEEFERLKPWLLSILKQEQTAWRTARRWAELFIPAANLDVWPKKKRRILATIRDGMDDIVMTHFGQREQTCWRLVKKKFFPNPDRCDRIRGERDTIMETRLDSD